MVNLYVKKYKITEKSEFFPILYFLDNLKLLKIESIKKIPGSFLDISRLIDKNFLNYATCSLQRNFKDVLMNYPKEDFPYAYNDGNINKFLIFYEKLFEKIIKKSNSKKHKEYFLHEQTVENINVFLSSFSSNLNLLKNYQQNFKQISRIEKKFKKLQLILNGEKKAYPQDFALFKAALYFKNA